jgi:cardiolipin synthase
MAAQFDQILKDGSRIFRAQGTFDHSKLMTVDGQWSFIGSSNLDSRSLRLNFEIDLEVFDADFARTIEARIDASLEGAEPVTQEELRRRPFVYRLFDRFLWLGSPYL